jgi:hypothetical protein
MSGVTPAIEAQIIRVLTAFENAANRIERERGRWGALPGAAGAYALRHPDASVKDIMAATGCSRTTARAAKHSLVGPAI